MSLFPAYNNRPSEGQPQGTERRPDEWLKNDSYKEQTAEQSKARRSRRDSPSSSSGVSRSPSSDRRRSAKKKKRRRSRSRSRKRSKKKRSRSPKDRRDDGHDEVFAKDKRGDKQLAYVNCAPYTLIPNYKLFTKRVMCRKGREGNFRKVSTEKNKEQPPRFHHKSYTRQFKRAGNVTDLSRSIEPRSKMTSLHSYFLAFRCDDEEDTSKVEESAGGIDDEPDFDEDDIKLDVIQVTTKEYNGRLRQEPNNIKLWLEFLAFQDKAVAVFGGDIPEDGKERKKNKTARDNAIVEKKLSIIKSAMEKNPRSVELAMERLNLSKRISEVSSLERQWKEALLMFPDNLDVIRHYLDFSCSHFTSFKVGKVTRAFRTCFGKLKGLHSYSTTSGARLEDEMVDVIVRLANFWAGAGYTERAVGLFQALLELNFRSPEFPGFYSLEDRLALFEPFWESAAPRIGEVDAIGWAAVMKAKTSNAASETNETFASMFEDEECVNPNNDDLEDNVINELKGHMSREELWRRLESGRDSRHWLPWRSKEEEAEDTERTVSYEDMEGFLFQFPNSKTSPAVFRLVMAYLDFLGVELHRGRELSLSGNLASTAWYCTRVGLDHTFDNEECFLSSLMGQSVTSFRQNPDVRAFVRRTITQLVQVYGEPHVNELLVVWLRHEVACVADHPKQDKKHALKTIKTKLSSVLNSDKVNLDLYCAFAMTVYQLDSYKASQKVIQMLKANFKHSLQLSLTALAIELKEALRTGQVPAEKVADIFDPDNMTRLHVLVQREVGFLSEAHLLARPLTSDGGEVLARASMEAWHIYFAEKSAENAYNFVDFVMSKIGPSGPLKELLHQVRVDMMLFAAHCDPMAGSLLERALGEGLRAAPTNRHFINVLKSRSLHISTNVANQFWRMTSDLAIKLPEQEAIPLKVAVVTCLLSKHKESMDRGEELVGPLNQAEHYLSTFLLKTGKTCNSPTLWRLLLWIYHGRCLRNQDLYYRSKSKYTKATDQLEPLRGLLFRALQDSPGAKTLIMDTLRYYCQNPVETDFPPHCQKSLQELMTEKEMRVRMPMEELEVLLEDE